MSRQDDTEVAWLSMELAQERSANVEVTGERDALREAVADVLHAHGCECAVCACASRLISEGQA